MIENREKRTEESSMRERGRSRVAPRPRRAATPPVPTFGFALDQLLHLALFQRVHHICQAALAPLRGAEGTHGRAAVAAGPPPTSAFLFTW